MTLPDGRFVLTNGARGESAQDISARMLFRTRQDMVSRSLVRAVADCYLDYRVELVSDFAGDQGEVALVAFHIDRNGDAPAHVGRLRDLYPDAAMAMLVNSPSQVPTGIEDLVGHGLLQGVVPVTLSLSIWLAAFGLLLNGGVYLPPEIMVGRPSHTRVAPPDRARRGEGGAWPVQAGPLPLKDLTHREQEVLRLLSLGFQNKIIASRMNLSEYTVKVHVHNIIHKLHVHNRTQAAAYWLGKTPRPDDPTAGERMP